jgi:hypothetical protein
MNIKNYISLPLLYLLFFLPKLYLEMTNIKRTYFFGTYINLLKLDKRVITGVVFLM